MVKSEELIGSTEYMTQQTMSHKFHYNWIWMYFQNCQIQECLSTDYVFRLLFLTSWRWLPISWQDTDGCSIKFSSATVSRIIVTDKQNHHNCVCCIERKHNWNTHRKSQVATVIITTSANTHSTTQQLMSFTYDCGTQPIANPTSPRRNRIHR
jgi:hypothetical protein